MTACAAGDRLAQLNRVFLQHRRALWFAALRIVRDRQIAEDLAQEAYLRAFQASESAPIEHIEAYLYRTIRNLALDHLRRLRTRERYEDPQAADGQLDAIPADIPSIETALIERERLRLFEAALQSLPLRARRAWALSQVSAWSYDRIARHLGVSRNTVYNDVKLVMGHCADALARFDRE
ncbi:sigma-70 family RNA polymerase sigma factor [Nordella sp. HKS 07]|uniref:RNA polymerase sigma factor n=1 Tax=Nordella sp. HKS 07 TaxID=2712222 RepID=UPI0013E20103|nr:sigma-70 family RNA polymerase sigma factor [Nordella sp. HKS 07]QIG52219.1 sigma-70 family RNA polymerase sigma factor [Nordella sp. HKS 07]